MKNFDEMPYGEELLREMYNTPRSEWSTQQIVEILQQKLNLPTLTELHVAKLYKEQLGLSLRNRLKVPAKPQKEKRVNVMDVLLAGLKTPENGSNDVPTEMPFDDLSEYDEGPEYQDEEVEYSGDDTPLRQPSWMNVQN